MSNVDKSREHKDFSYTLFAMTNLVLSSLIVLTFAIVLPRSVWNTQWQAPFWKLVVVFVSMKMFNCFLEYVFHRYVLHKPVAAFLSYFYKSHTKHHSLTRIGKRRTPSGKEIPYVFEIENSYPITKPEQAEASFFPWYSLVVFSVVISPLLVLLQWVFPTYPWFVGGNLALLASLVLYEFVHAFEHWPNEWWDAKIEHPKWGSFWRKVYSFHLRHHAVIDCNEAISGFFTLPIGDWVFGTMIMPTTLYVDGGEWEEKDFVSPKPVRFIAWLDKVTQELVEKRRLKERVKREFG